jgi:DNA-binding GntR family transcriptional regulator
MAATRKKVSSQPAGKTERQKLPIVAPAPAAENLTARVTEALRQSIVDAEYPLGEALSESSLAAKLGVSRTPVREALTALQRQGLIVIRPQYGSFVFQPSEEDVAELCEFRRLMEVAALRFAYARRRSEALAQMQQALAAMDAADQLDDQRAYSRADALFHESIVENSANTFVIEAYKLVSGRVGALRSHNLIRADELRGKSTAAHRAIAHAFEKGDLPLAEEVIDEHVSRMNIAFRSAMRRGLAVPPARRPTRNGHD